MFKKIHRILLFSIALMVLLTPAGQAATQPTDTSASWAANEINKWTSNGVFKGNPDGTFKPDKPITRAEFAVVLNRVFAFGEKAKITFTDVPAKAWYAKDLAGAVAADVFTGDGGKFRPNDPISRQEAAVVLYKAFNLTTANNAAADSFSDSKDIASWSRDAICAMVENNFLKGQPGNIFAPKKNLTRAEFVKVIDNILKDIKNKAGTYTGTIDGSLAVNTGAVTLKDMTVGGDLYITQGVGAGSVTLDNVTVKGRTVVLGGGENSIVLNNTSLQGDLIVIKKDGKIRIVAQGSTEVTNTVFRSGGRLTGHGFGKVEVIRIPEGSQIALDGDFSDVLIDAPGVSLDVTGGTIADLQIGPLGLGAHINLDTDATVTEFTADASVTVEGTGTIKTAIINADGTVFSKRPEKMKLASGVIATVGGLIIADLDETVPGGGAIIPGGGTGGGGGNTNQQDTNINIENKKMLLTTGTIDELNLSDCKDTDRVIGITFTTNIAASNLSITGIQSPIIGKMAVSNTLTFGSTTVKITMRDLIGVLAGDNDSMSLLRLRDLFGDYIIVSGTISGTGAYAGYTTRYFSESVIFGKSSTPTPSYNTWVDVSYNVVGDVITAVIKPEQGDTEIKSIGITNVLMSTIGQIPESVKVEDGQWHPVATEKTEIANEIGAFSSDKTWNKLKLKDLSGHRIYCKKAGSDIVYTIIITG